MEPRQFSCGVVGRAKRFIIGLAARRLLETYSCYKIGDNESISGFGRLRLAPLTVRRISTIKVSRDPMGVRYEMEGVRRLNDRAVFVTSIINIAISSGCVSKAKGFRVGSANLIVCSRKRCFNFKSGLKDFNCSMEGAGGWSVRTTCP